MYSAFTASKIYNLIILCNLVEKLHSPLNVIIIKIDADTKLTVMEQNMPRDIGYLSAGKQDLVGVCMRMALVEAMYKEEKPFLIFDDPFVNLDDNNFFHCISP